MGEDLEGERSGEYRPGWRLNRVRWRVRIHHMLNPSELRLTFLVNVRETAWRAAFSDELSVAGGEGKALKTTKPKGVPA